MQKLSRNMGSDDINSSFNTELNLPNDEDFLAKSTMFQVFMVIHLKGKELEDDIGHLAFANIIQHCAKNGNILTTRLILSDNARTNLTKCFLAMSTLVSVNPLEF